MQCDAQVWASPLSLAATYGILISLYSSGYWNVLLPRVCDLSYDRTWDKSHRFPHSDISGSKVARHLPEAYRRHATSFIAISSQGIHHTPLNFLLGNSKTTFKFLIKNQSIEASTLCRGFFFFFFILPHKTILLSLRHFCSTSDPKRPRWDQSQSGIKLSKFLRRFWTKKPLFWKRAQIKPEGILPSLTLHS